MNHPIHSEIVDYHGSTDTKTHKGFLSTSSQTGHAQPAVLIAHAWAGQGEFERKQAELVASWGFTAFAIDLYGNGACGKTVEENQELMQPFFDKRTRITDHFQIALDTAQRLEPVAKGPIAAIGFCFGGLCVLDCARANIPDLAGVVSLHGLLKPLARSETDTIRTPALVLHGHDDPMVSEAELKSFQKEMSERKADWQVHQFAHTKHGFTNPSSSNPKLGIEYHEKSAARAMNLTKSFLEEVLL